MRLAPFILANIEPILQDWESFARSLGAVSSSMDAVALRDHAELVIRAIALDIVTPQTLAAQDAKSKGQAPARDARLPPTAASSHGSLRAAEGFTLEQLFAEFRALRACVLRLWALEETDVPPSTSLYDQLRFNEAIDEALADSVRTFSNAVDQLQAAKTRRRMDSLGGISAGLGNDMDNVLVPMRACLDTIVEQSGPETVRVARAVQRGVERLKGISRSLCALAIDPNRSDGSPDAMRLHEWWASAISPLTWTLPRGVALHPVGLHATDPALPPVRFPAHALMQVVFDLVQNAADALSERNAANPHAEPTGNIWVSAALVEGSSDLDSRGAEGAVHLTVRDDGPGMSPTALARCTEVFFTTRAKDYGAGLGLFLVRGVLERHGGNLIIRSDEGEGCSITLVLPIADEALLTNTPASPAAAAPSP